MPFLHQAWISALQSKDPDNRTLEKLMKALEDEAKLRDPKHTRRMKLLQTKRGSDKHSDFLERLKENYNVAEFEEMSGDEVQIHLFIREADAQMSRIATEILEKENPSVNY